MSRQTSVSLQEKFCLCFCFQDVSVANGTTELLHTEHIWYPRIREVNDEHCLLTASLCFLFSVLVMPSILQLLTLSSFFFPATDMFICAVKFNLDDIAIK